MMPMSIIGARTCRANSAASGFTLAELMVVLVLIGIVLSVVLPQFSGVGDHERLRTSARRLAGLAEESYSQAVTKSRPWFFCIDLEENRIWLATVRPGQEGEAGRESRFYVLPRGVKFKDVIHPEKGRIKEGRVSFGYWSRGASEPGTIHLEIQDGREMTIFLRPWLGRTEIEEGYVREESF